MGEKKQTKLPASVFVWWNEWNDEGDGSQYLLAATDIHEIPDDVKDVGIYRLSLTRKLQIKRILV